MPHPAPPCPYCRRPAEMVKGTAIYPHRPDLAEESFWRGSPCRAWTGCHDIDTPRQRGMGDGTWPKGTLANAELRKLRHAAHEAFDPLWKGSRNRRSARILAYAWLAGKLRLMPDDCHVGKLDTAGCLAVIAACRNTKLPVFP